MTQWRRGCYLGLGGRKGTFLPPRCDTVNVKAVTGAYLHPNNITLTTKLSRLTTVRYLFPIASHSGIIEWSNTPLSIPYIPSVKQGINGLQCLVWPGRWSWIKWKFLFPFMCGLTSFIFSKNKKQKLNYEKSYRCIVSYISNNLTKLHTGHFFCL